MSFIVDSSGTEKACKMLAGIPGGANKAIARAINKSARTAVTGVIKGIKKNYTVQSKKARAYGTYIRKAKPSNLQATINIHSGLFALSYFKYSPKNPERAMPFAQVKKGGGGSFKNNAFVARMPTGHIGIFERHKSKSMKGKGPRAKKRGTGRTKGIRSIHEFYGPSVAYMAKNPKIHADMNLSVRDTFNTNLEMEISKILNKF